MQGTDLASIKVGDAQLWDTGGLLHLDDAPGIIEGVVHVHPVVPTA